MLLAADFANTPFASQHSARLAYQFGHHSVSHPAMQGALSVFARGNLMGILGWYIILQRRSWDAELDVGLSIHLSIDSPVNYCWCPPEFGE